MQKNPSIHKMSRCSAAVLGALMSMCAVGAQAETHADQTAKEKSHQAAKEKAQEVIRSREETMRNLVRFDHLAEKGGVIRVPPPSDSILHDAGGFRSWLADRGFGIQMMSLNSYAYDLRGSSNRRNHHEHFYNGQDHTASSVNQVYLTYDMNRVGLKNAQLSVGLVNNLASWSPMGPRTKLALTRFTYYQTFDNGKWELKFGYIGNSLEYIGAATGGSLTGGTQGPNAVIPYQLGLNRVPLSTPGFNITYHGKNGFYNRFGIQRSTNPDGAQTERDLNEFNFKFSSDNARALVINEIGVKRSPSAGSPATWFRAGVIFNKSKFKNFEIPQKREDKTYGGYIAIDDQMTQKSGPLAFRGWYGGLTAHYADSDVNIFNQYYEARLYGIGISDSRPFDMLSMLLTHTKYSKNAQALYGKFPGYAAAKNSTGATVSYTARLYPGAYGSLGLSYTKNPAPVSSSPAMKNSLNLLVGLNLFF